jgi:hypothetical protein
MLQPAAWGKRQAEHSVSATPVVFSPKKPESISKAACSSDISLVTACEEDYSYMVNLIASELSFYYWTNNVRFVHAATLFLH